MNNYDARNSSLWALITTKKKVLTFTLVANNHDKQVLTDYSK